jgi:hypothetical protein
MEPVRTRELTVDPQLAHHAAHTPKAGELALPLAPHLAKLTTEYALPHELTEGREDQNVEEADGSESEEGGRPRDDQE